LIGRVVLESAESPDVLQDTLVVVIGDDGTPDHVLSATQVPDELGVQSPPFPPNHGKFQVYELGLRVPLIVTGMGAQPGGTCRSLVSAVDVWSTVLDVCAADVGTLVPSSEIDSHSFAERLIRPVGPVSSPDRSEIYAE
jgi:arylsulfatase A-like enzyme